MPQDTFQTPAGQSVTAVTADEMRAIDRVAVDTVGLQILQMMEHAGRALGWHVCDLRHDSVVVVAGNGGNGGGGLVCARYLANRNVPVRVVTDRPPAELTGSAAQQYRILEAMAVPVTTGPSALAELDSQTLIVDALVGYGLSGTIRSPAAEHITQINAHHGAVVSLDVPSGIDATTGVSLGTAVSSDRTVTLALPKTGLDAAVGELYLADISIPQTVYERLDIEYTRPFGDAEWVRLEE